MMILFWGAGAQLQAQACVSCLLVMPQNTFTDKKKKKKCEYENAQNNTFVKLQGLSP